MPDDAPRAGGETPETRVDNLLRDFQNACEMVVVLGDSNLSETTKLRAVLRNALRASLLERHRDGERADWWEAETRRVLRAVCAEGTDTTERVTRLALNLRPANAHTPPPSVRDRVREERETIPEPTHD